MADAVIAHTIADLVTASGLGRAGVCWCWPIRCAPAYLDCRRATSAPGSRAPSRSACRAEKSALGNNALRRPTTTARADSMPANPKSLVGASLPSLARLRATRERRQRGVLLVRLEPSPALLDGMVTAGLLPAAERNDADVATHAVLGCLERPAAAPLPGSASSFADRLGTASRRGRALAQGGSQSSPTEEPPTVVPCGPEFPGVPLVRAQPTATVDVPRTLH
jgi:hypothetical protein